MKVIAHTSASRLLVEATGDELAHLMGLSDTYDAGVKRKVNYDYHEPHKIFPIGFEIPVSKLWKIIEHERGRPGAITSTVEQLRALATMLESVNVALQTPSFEPVTTTNTQGT